MVLTLIHGFAVAAIAVSQLSLTIKVPLLLLLALSLAHGLRTSVFREGSRVVVALTLRDAGQLELEYGDGRRVSATIDPSSTVLHWLIALHLRSGSKRISMLLLPDMVDAESWRELSVLLRSIRNDR